jgi:hypothetical protein
VLSHAVNFASVRWCCTACADAGLVGDEASCLVCATIEEIESRKHDRDVHGLDRSSSMFSRCETFSMYNVEEGKTVIGMFTDWLLSAFDQRYPTLVYSHNGGRFDEHFILRELYARHLTPDLTMSGNKIYQMSVRKNINHAKLLFR